jgi:gluconate kinase
MNRPDVGLAYFKGDETLIARRIATRHEHFIPQGLLHSQFEALGNQARTKIPLSSSRSSCNRARSSRKSCLR